MPQRIVDEGLDEFLTSIDDVKGASGLDLLSLLDDEAEERLESVGAVRGW